MTLTKNEKNIIALSEIEHYSLEEIADKMNYSLRQIQRIKKSADRKIINYYISDIFENNKEI